MLVFLYLYSRIARHEECLPRIRLVIVVAFEFAPGYLRRMEGMIKWISVRPTRKAPVESKESVFADVSSGLSGDHDTQPHRQVTLISLEALEKTARLLGVSAINPAKTRRNILVAGLDFSLAPGTQLRLGEAIVQITGPCLPCARMDENLGEGGREAMADAGGLTARILMSGRIAVGDIAEILPAGVRSGVNYAH